MRNKTITLFIVAHKKPSFFKKIRKRNYVYISVGGNYKDKINDNSGINISAKNWTFCELTATYWAFQNCNSQYIGILHYRRFLSKNNKIASSNFFLKKLEDYDMILPTKMVFEITSYEQYKLHRGTEELTQTTNIIRNKFPSYLDTWLKDLEKKEIHICNILIAKRKIFIDYCNFIFPILFELEKVLIKPRACGYIAERLMDTFVEYNHIKYFECDLVTK